MKKIMFLPVFIALLFCFTSNAQTFDNLISNPGANKTLTFNVHANSTKDGNAYRFRTINLQGQPSGYLFMEYDNQVKGSWKSLMTFNQGKVGIGIDISLMREGYNLFVANGILTEKVKVALKNSNDWADHVFEEDYELMSLKDVEKFIRENKHLPGISSAETLVEEGIDLGAMQAKLLEKIEELTLYLIQKDKEIEELKRQMKSLVEQE